MLPQGMLKVPELGFCAEFLSGNALPLFGVKVSCFSVGYVKRGEKKCLHLCVNIHIFNASELFLYY